MSRPFKCKEFMVGDWITDSHCYPMQVVTVGEDWLNADFPGNEGDVWEFDDNTNPPAAIWITKNSHLRNKLKPYLTIDELDKLEYLHRAQQLLRIRGLFNVADNLKL